MSTVETIITRMMNDTDFANAVVTNTERVLSEYKLTADEILQFKQLTQAETIALAMDLEERKSFSRESVVLVQACSGGGYY